MNYLDIFPDDVIIKILDTRCDDIERDIYKLRCKLDSVKNSVKGLSIEKKSKEQLDEELEYSTRNGGDNEDNEDNEEGFNGRYNIYFDNLHYSCENYLYNTIYYGECIMKHTIIYYDDNYDIEDYALFESEVIRNPIMLDLLRFTSKYVDEDTHHRFVEGYDIEDDASRKDENGDIYDTVSLSLGS